MPLPAAIPTVFGFIENVFPLAGPGEHGKAIPGQLERLGEGLVGAEGAKLSVPQAVDRFYRFVRRTTGEILTFERELGLDPGTSLSADPLAGMNTRLAAYRLGGAVDTPRFDFARGLRALGDALGLELPSLERGPEGREARREFYAGLDPEGIAARLTGVAELPGAASPPPPAAAAPETQSARPALETGFAETEDSGALALIVVLAAIYFMGGF